MDEQKSVLYHSFYNKNNENKNNNAYIAPHSKIIRQDNDTIIIEDENTIYEIDKQCAIQRGYIPVTQLHFLVIASTAAQKNQNPDPVIAAAATAVIPAASAAAAIVAIAAAQKDQNPDPVIAAATPISIIICQSITSAVIAAACCS